MKARFHKFGLSAAFILFLQFSGTSFAEKPYDTPAIRKALEELRAEFSKAELKDADSQSRRYQISGLIARYQSILEANEPLTEGYRENEVSGMESLPEALNAALKKIREELSARNAELDSQTAAKVEQILKEAGERVMSAKNAEDLDGTISKLGTTRFSLRQSSRSNVLSEKLNTAIRFVGRWQEMLAFKAAGRKADADGVINELVGNTRDSAYLIVPRSFLLSFISEPAKKETGQPAAVQAEPDSTDLVVAAVQNAKNVDDIPRVTTELQKLADSMKRDRARSLCDAAVRALQHIEHIQAAYKSGLRMDIFDRPESLADRANAQHIRSSLVLLYTDLQRRVLPIYIRATENEQPKADETSSQYLLRLYEKVVGDQDWERALLVSELLNRQEPKAVDSEALRLLLTAQRFDKVGLWANAVVEYANATRKAGKQFPVDSVNARLETIRREHPQEYAAGVERSMSTDPRVHGVSFANPAVMKGANPKPAPEALVPPIPTPSYGPSPSPAKK